MRIILADDHPLVRESLRQHLEKLADKTEIAEASSLQELLTLAREPTDMVVMDLQMPGMNGPRSVMDVRESLPSTPIVVVSGHTEPAVIRAAMQYGANGYIPKTARGKSLIMALQMVLEGETYLPANLLEENAGATTRGASGAPLAGGFEKLSEREACVLRRLVSGKSNKEIASDLDIQEVTVKVHLRNII